MCGIGGFVDFDRDARRGGPVLSGGICSPAARLFVLLWNIPYTWA